MFLFGTLAHRYFGRIKVMFEGTLLVWFMIFVAIQYVPHSKWPFWASAAHLLCSRLSLAGLTLSAAFSGRWLSDRLLHGQDISYGLYIYHAPIFNLFYHWGLGKNRTWYVLGLLFSLFAAGLSWVIVEKPALALKGMLFKRVAQFLQQVVQPAWTKIRAGRQP